jgi:photosystem II cytochrome c550
VPPPAHGQGGNQGETGDQPGGRGRHLREAARDGTAGVRMDGRGVSGGDAPLFAQNCINCHVGGTTLPNPIVSLSLASLQGATPPRDNINALVAYMREPFSYDGSEPIYWCRTVPESWMSQKTIENLAAFIVRAAQKAPAWGTNDIDQ